MVNRIADALISHGAVEYGHFILASGATSTYYLDIKTALTDPDLLEMVCKEIAKNYPSDIVAGVAVGGVPLAVGVSLSGKRPFAIIRSTEKEHGKSGNLIGKVKGRHVLLVEDVTTSGGSALYGVKVLRDAGATINTVVTVVDREQGAAAALIKDHVTLHALVKASEITK
jgi:orotate phosphoribosyltransferase